jgi:hypothetical protein
MSLPARIAKALNGRPANGGGFSCHCPVPNHGRRRGDLNPSLLIRDGDFPLRLHCLAGCDRGAVLDELKRRGLLEDLARSPDHTKPKASAPNPIARRIVAAYDYKDENGEVLFQVVRYQPKSFRQRRPDGAGGWSWSVQGVRLVPYRLPDLIEALATEHPVLIVEGEKDVDALWAIGIPATCNSGGASKWRSEYSEFLRGADVILIPDDDQPGRTHMDGVAASLRGIVTSIRVLKLPNKDVSDWLAAGGTAGALWKLVETAPTSYLPDEQDTKSIGCGTAQMMNDRKSAMPVIRTAADLQCMTFAPIKYIVPGLIVEGCVLLAGRPKVCKSWLALDIGLAVAASRYCLGDRKCEQGSVLYLALEDGDRRMQSRMTKLLPTLGGEWPKKFHYATRWPRADQGGVEKIDKWCEEHPDARLVEIDVLAKFRPPSRGKNNAYEQDYAALSKLQELATRRSITILVVHHTRKGASEDPVEEISGTLGLVGAADAFLVLKKASAGATLAGRCRDTEDVDLAIQFNKETCRWTVLGKASDVNRSHERARVLALLENASDGLAVRDIIVGAQLRNRNAADILLFKMTQDGEIARPLRGIYCLPKYAGKIGKKERSSNQPPESAK